MINQMQVFENKEFGKIEVLMIDGKPYFPAAECATALGYSKTRNAIDRHCPHALKRGVGVQTGIKSDGSPAMQTIEKTFIPEGDLYRLIIRSKLPAAVRFEIWVCDEVLPTIRKHGAYITDETLHRMQEDNAFAQKLMQSLEDERAKTTALLDYVDKIEPKARYYDTILQCPDAVQVSIIAKDYGMTAVAFNKMLHRLSIQFKVGGTWVLYKDFANRGFTVTKTYLVNDKVAAIHTCWTQKGRLWLYELLKTCGMLPIAEKIAIN